MNKDIKYLVEKLFDDDLLDNDELTLDELSITKHIIPKDFVDLGLPSGTLWCKKNLGANAELDPGLYYMWGDTLGYEPEQWEKNKNYTTFRQENYKYYDEDLFKSGYINYSKYNGNDKKRILDYNDDAAYVASNGIYQIPSIDDFEELLKECKLEKLDGPKGDWYYKATGPNGNYILFPSTGSCDKWLTNKTCNGYYWTSSIYLDDYSRFQKSKIGYESSKAFYIKLEYSKLKYMHELMCYSPRFVGMAIRPVIKN